MLWDKPGKQNTAATVEQALQAAHQQGIRHLVVASNTGETARQVLDADTEGLRIICVTHHVGFKEPGFDEMSAETRAYLKDRGVEVLTTTHVLAGIDRTIRYQFGGLWPPEIVAYALRMFGQGVKVCVEIAVMALDAGLIPYGENIIAIGGTGRGADTAAVIRPAHSNNLFETRVIEVICRPRV